MPRWLPWALVLLLSAGWAVDAWRSRTPGPEAPAPKDAEADRAASIRPADEIAALGMRRGRPWLAVLKGDGPAAVKARVREAVLAALDAGDPIELYAALHVSRLAPADALGVPAQVRVRIERYVDADAPWLARAAIAAASNVDPKREDVVPLARLIADGHLDEDGEEAAALLVRTSEGRIEGLAADAVLNLLRAGAQTKPAFVMRGLRAYRSLAPTVRTRLLDIVATAEPHDYDSHYFFHFLAPRLEPKSDRLVALALERIGQPGGTDTIELIRSLQRGTSAAQRLEIAHTLVEAAHEATNPGFFRQLLLGIRMYGDDRHIAQLQALTGRDDLDDAMRAQIAAAIEALRRE